MGSIVGGAGAGRFEPRWEEELKSAKSQNDSTNIVFTLFTELLPAIGADSSRRDATLEMISKLKDDVDSLALSTARQKAFVILDIFYGMVQHGKTPVLTEQLINLLPFDTEEQKKLSLAFFRNLTDGHIHLAKWISSNRIALEDLPLTADDAAAIAPHLTYYYYRGKAAPILPLERFTAVEKLTLFDDEMRDLPPLPASVTELKVKSDHLVNIAALPPRLQKFDCSHCPLLTSLRAPLPPTLTDLSCYNCASLTELHLPPSLRKLDCSFCPNLAPPALNEGLENLECSGCHFTKLPDLPSSLKTLDCRECPHLESLPPLPKEVEVMRDEEPGDDYEL